ncbi:Biopolymer transport protein ExbB [Polystyrenella longa]|uniref:Biopolymer transport protein ExbB n=1 Tax=Polystyrenella longa TaxID=2528007 RepID=A0A518CRX7_9PLAN|nr:MotA/TolQ/ExbB proton channel family protein [Polystyrenella longa]QDU81981.1 Biopolymer transport protein ExbB [Polystyrenella longa]
MDAKQIFLEYFGYIIYAAMALAAMAGLACIAILNRNVKKKSMGSRANSDAFLEEVSMYLEDRDFDAVVELCDSPPYWSKAVPQLIMVAIENKKLGLTKVRRMLAERFEREILAELEYTTSWVITVVKSAPMLGLLGTVTGMISAFGKIAAMQETGTDPAQLANDISFALLTTAYGLAIAIPLVVLGNKINVQIGKLQDSVQDDLGRFLNDFERAIRS